MELLVSRIAVLSPGMHTHGELRLDFRLVLKDLDPRLSFRLDRSDSLVDESPGVDFSLMDSQHLHNGLSVFEEDFDTIEDHLEDEGEDEVSVPLESLSSLSCDFNLLFLIR